MIEDLYKVVDISDVHTGETRTDGRYPLRIGCTVKNIFAHFGFCMTYEYVSDAGGNPRDGVLRTSGVVSVHKTHSKMIVETINSIYLFEKLGGNE